MRATAGRSGRLTVNRRKNSHFRRPSSLSKPPVCFLVRQWQVAVCINQIPSLSVASVLRPSAPNVLFDILLRKVLAIIS